MIFKVPEDSQILTWMIIGVISTWGGVVRYLIDVKDEVSNINWNGMFSQIIVSGFTGVIGGLSGFEMGFSIYMVYAASGLFGAMGSGAIDVVKNRMIGRSAGN